MSDLDFLPTSTTSAYQLLQNQIERINAIHGETPFFYLICCVMCVIDTGKRHMWGLTVDSSKGDFKEGFQIR